MDETSICFLYDDNPPMRFWISEHRIGWPFRSMSIITTKADTTDFFRPASLDKHPQATSRLSQIRSSAGLRIPPWSDGRQQRGASYLSPGLPLFPIARGFALNTLIFSCALAALAEIGRSLRSGTGKRFGPGRCKICGYETRGLTKCPECGKRDYHPSNAIKPTASLS